MKSAFSLALITAELAMAKPAPNDKIAFVFQMTRHGARSSLQGYEPYGFEVPAGYLTAQGMR
jgi:hypothetical protein